MMLMQAQRPLVMFGAASNRPRLAGQLTDFIRRTGIPFFNTQMGKGTVAGIGKKQVESIVSHWEKDRANRELHAMLRGYGVGQSLSARIMDRYGTDALTVVTRTPYRLAQDLRGVGFRTADAIARDQGLPLDDPGRAEAAVVHVLREAEGQGHCFLPRGELLGRCLELEVPREVASDAA